jgi:cytochrome P450
VDLAPVVRRLVLEVVVRAFFGERLAPRAEEIGRLFRSSQEYLESPAIRQLPHPFPFTRRARVRSDRRSLDRLIDREIAASRQHPSGDPLDVLEALVQDGSLTDPEIRDQVVTLIGAGFDTTSASLSWMLCRASRREDVWAALRAEADQVLGPIGADPVLADPTVLSRLVVADRVMRETLRLHPAGVLSPREAAHDVRVGKHVIRRGTLILWSAHLAGRNLEAWGEALEFDPDRFADPTPEQRALADSAWVPFGGGTRNCVGFMLAQMELTLIISRLAQSVDVTAPAGPVPSPVGMVVNRPKGGVPLRVAVRG